jgi:hypothetical protein
MDIEEFSALCLETQPVKSAANDHCGQSINAIRNYTAYRISRMHALSKSNQSLSKLPSTKKNVNLTCKHQSNVKLPKINGIGVILFFLIESNYLI